jgi:protein tyrosine phosphatase (PTP) superfamily phosphohydrolase (DUF442 family)
MTKTASATATVTAIETATVSPSTGSPRPSRPARRGRLRLGLAGFVVFLVTGNTGILAASAWARHTTAVPDGEKPIGVGNFQVVDDGLWRGAAPSPAGYRWLASQGVRTVIDLRAEENLDRDPDLLAGLGLDLVAIPIRDGQTPQQSEVDRFLAAVETSPGRVYVHCGAGVGRTGTMVASYLVAAGKADGWMALRRNLAVGPPSLEQIAFAAGLDDGSERPSPYVVALSRVLDAPRRLWVRLRPY